MTGVHYNQATMAGLDEADGQRHVAWIPNAFARVGCVLTIDGLPGRWRVIERGETKPAAWVEPKSRDHLHQREASDI